MREALVQALQMSGSYIVFSENRDGMLYTADMSRRGRAVELWASLMALGRKGVAELIEDLHQKAVYFATGLRKAGFQICNEVCFNQVLVSCENSERTKKTLENIQASGECWCGGAVWQEAAVIRISVCSYRTTLEDIDRSINAFVTARKKAED